MNKENFKLLRDAIDSIHPNQFNMRFYYGKIRPFSFFYSRPNKAIPADTSPRFDDSKSCGCIVGWATAAGSNDDDYISISNVQEFLGVSPQDLSYIAFGDFSEKSLRDVTKYDALLYLDKVLETGNVRSKI